MCYNSFFLFEANNIISIIKNLLRQSKRRKNTIDNVHLVPRSEHNISKTNINPNALKVLNVLNKSSFQGYLVGGSVRDLLLHKSPKDFDVATSANPNQIKKLFKNARIIGRRFKLVHIMYGRDIIEVATFRSSNKTNSQHQQQNDHGMLVKDNVYGTMEDDAFRRDFTINSLYYDIETGGIIDYTGGFYDIQARTIRIIGDANLRYQEDPVRMLRAVRFAAKLDFNIDTATADPIFKNCGLITHVSSSRLFDEIIKIYQCGAAKKAQVLLERYNVFAKLFPQTGALQSSDYQLNELINLALESTDSRIQERKPVTPAFICAVLLWFPMMDYAQKLRNNGEEPLPAIEQSMAHVLSTQNKIVTIPKRFTQVVREIWMLQYRFPKRAGKRAQNLLRHPRFRAAYDFLALRALAGDAEVELANWWTTYQEVDSKTRDEMCAKIKHI